jgi:hypothetical protein
VPHVIILRLFNDKILFSAFGKLHDELINFTCRTQTTMGLYLSHTIYVFVSEVKQVTQRDVCSDQIHDPDNYISQDDRLLCSFSSNFIEFKKNE